MLTESIILAIFICSFGGVIVILARKMPVLSILPQNGNTGFKKHQIIFELESKIKNFFAAFDKQIYLHKVLSWLKCMILRIEVQIDHLLHNIRQKSKKNKPK